MDLLIHLPYIVSIIISFMFRLTLPWNQYFILRLKSHFFFIIFRNRSGTWAYLPIKWFSGHSDDSALLLFCHNGGYSRLYDNNYIYKFMIGSLFKKPDHSNYFFLSPVLCLIFGCTRIYGPKHVLWFLKLFTDLFHRNKKQGNFKQLSHLPHHHNLFLLYGFPLRFFDDRIFYCCFLKSLF